MAYKYEWHSDGFIVKLWDTLSIDEIIYVNSQWKDAEIIDTIKWQIWDFTNADLQYIFQSDAQDPKVTLSIDYMHVGLVAKDNYSKMLLNTYASRSKELGSKWDIHLFDTIEEALKHFNVQTKNSSTM